MNRIINFIKKYLPIILFGTFLAAILLPFYKDGKMISGGEGAYFLDFPLMLKNYGYSWLNTGTGMFATSLNFAYVFHLSFLQSLVPDVRIINFIMIFSLYFLPFSALYILSLCLGLNPLLAVLMAAFYIANPFIANFMKSINQWNMLAAYILPSFFLIIFNFYNRRWKLFFFFGLNSLVFSFANANPPTMVLYQVAVVLFILIISFYKEQKIKLGSLINNYFTVVLSFFLFNFWWIINWLYVFTDAGKAYSKQIAISWLRSGGGFIPAFWRTITLTSLLQSPINPDYDYFARHYSRFFVPLILLVPMIVLAYFFFVGGIRKKLYLLTGLIFIFVGFLAKGVNGVFGGVYEFMVMNIPFFNIFKSAEEKWGLLFTFFLTILLIFAFKELKQYRFYRLTVGLMAIYVFYCSIPFATGNFLPDYNFQNKIIGSKEYADKKEYVDLRNNLNRDPLQYRVLSLPGSNNYQVALQVNGKRFYTGNDPVLSNTTKPFIAPYTGVPLQNFDGLFDSITKNSYQNLLGLFNIKKIVVNRDAYPWFGFREEMTVSQTEEYLNKKFGVQKNGPIDLYDTDNFFLPRFYVPEDIIYTPGLARKDLWIPVSDDKHKIRSAIYLENNDQTPLKDLKTKYYITGELQGAVDKQQLREGNAQLNPAGVLFPYARWRPGGFIYKYVLEKENQAMKEAALQNELLFERNLFYAAKRISEIQKWDKDFSDEEYREQLEKYRVAMTAAVDILEKFSQEKEDAFPFLAKTEVSVAAHEKRLTDVLKGDFGTENNERLDSASQILLELEERLDRIIVSGFSQQRYFFDVSNEGNYEVLVEKQGMPGDLRLEKVNIGGSELSVSEFTEKQTLENWKSFGKTYFKQGRYYFSLKGPDENLLSEEFTGLQGLAEMSQSGLNLAFSGKVPIFQKIKDWKPLTAYRLAFKYKGNGKLNVSLNEYFKDVDKTWFDRGVEPQPVGINFASKEELDLSDGWKGFVGTVNSSFRVDFATLFFSGSSDALTPVEIKDLKIDEIIEPKIILKKIFPEESPLGIPRITFKKINPTKYLVNVSDVHKDYLLVFSESFHRGWKAYISQTQNSKVKSQNYGEIVGSYFDGEIKEVKAADNYFDKDILQTINKKSIPEDRHILINGYANSWLITPEDADNSQSYTIIIEYWPQKLFYAGMLISMIAILVCCLFVVCRLTKKAK